MSERLPVSMQGGPMQGGMVTDPALFEQIQRVAKVYADADLVPQHMRKISNCILAIDMAMRLNENPLIVMQNVYFVSGKPGWNTSYLIARANRSGRLDGPIRWKSEGTGEALKVTAIAELEGIEDPVEAVADMAMAKAEGWTKNPKYKSMPEHMLRYRSATFLIRQHLPEVMLGLPPADELEDMKAAGTLERGSDGVFVPSARPRRDRELPREPVDLTPQQEDPPAAAVSEAAVAADAPATAEGPQASVTGFELITWDGEIQPFDNAEAFAEAYHAVLLTAPNAEALDEMWEANKQPPGALSDKQESLVKTAYSTRMRALTKPAESDREEAN